MSQIETSAALCATENASCRVIRIKELMLLLGLSRSTIYDKLNPSSKRHDPSFPKPVKLGSSAVGWRLLTVMEWINSLHTTH